MNLLDLLAGPSGAGKCTFVELILGPLLSGSVFVNADEIARALADEPATHAYDAALIAAQTGERPIERERPLIALEVFVVRLPRALLEALTIKNLAFELGRVREHRFGFQRPVSSALP
jgi:predicted ABC-type ATPase